MEGLDLVASFVLGGKFAPAFGGHGGDGMGERRRQDLVTCLLASERGRQLGKSK